MGRCYIAVERIVSGRGRPESICPKLARSHQPARTNVAVRLEVLESAGEALSVQPVTDSLSLLLRLTSGASVSKS